MANARIGEKNWFAFSWKITLSSPTLAQHASGALDGIHERKMKIEIRLTGSSHAEIIRDLSRAHPFAAERVGFASGRAGSLVNQGKLVLLNRYHSIPDDQYVDDPRVGARIGSAAITAAMQAVYYGRPGRGRGFSTFTCTPARSERG